MRLVAGWRSGMVVAAAMLLAGPVAAERARDKGESARDAADKVICKRFVETGSLVRGQRTCKTKAEWERDRENVRTQMNNSGGCNSAESGVCGL